MIEIDGGRGEGGGQVLRVALALAAATGKDVRVDNVRAARPAPGLAPQHAAAVQALAEVTDGVVEGAARGSRFVVFRPGTASGGAHDVRIPTAGSLTLVLQTLLPALAASGKSWSLDLEGGTDVLWSPPWDHFARVHVANLARLGVEIEASVERRGFYPVGGGKARVEVHASRLHPHDFADRGSLRRVEASVALAGLPVHVAERAEAALRERLLGEVGRGLELRVAREHHRGPGKGLAVQLTAVFERGVLGADAVGKLGYPAEKVGDDAARRLLAEIEGSGAVDVHEADALPVFLALSGGGSFTVRGLSPHARTVLDLVPEFTPFSFDVAEEPGQVAVTCR